MWLAYVFSAIVRGTGDTLTPARAMIAASAMQIPASGALTLGSGPVPSLGIVGPAAALILCHGLAAIYLAAHLWHGTGGLRLRVQAIRWRPIADIMQVGGLGLVHSATIAMTVVAVTGFVGRYGTTALAGYGLGSRLELMLIPVSFGVGAALTAAVGINIGAGNHARARRIAWTGCAASFVVIGAIGAIVAIVPELWLDRFTADAGARAYGGLYLAIVAPFYGVFGAGQALYFASQGTGRMLLPVTVSVVRLLAVVGLGALALALSWDVGAVFAGVSVGLMIVGVGQGLCLLGPAWRPRAHP